MISGRKITIVRERSNDELTKKFHELFSSSVNLERDGGVEMFDFSREFLSSSQGVSEVE